jgi:Tol biopolymer transport system component
VQKIEPAEGLIDCAPRWSPDGTKLVYQERADTEDDVGNLFVYDLSTGEGTQVTDLQLTEAWWWFLSPSFSQHGDNSIIFHMPRTSSSNTQWDVWSVPATGGREPRLMMRNASWPMTNPGGLGDPYAVQFLEPSANDLGGRSIMNGHPCCRASAETLVEANEAIWWPAVSPTGQRIAYQDGGTIYVVGVTTGESSAVGEGETAEWLDSDTLIVAP